MSQRWQGLTGTAPAVRKVVFHPGDFSAFGPKGADGMTTRDTVHLAEGATDDVLWHELVHAQQQTIDGPAASRQSLEQEADRLAIKARQGEPFSVKLAAGRQPRLFHVAERVLKRSESWLEGRAYKTISKHVARHLRRMTGRAVHGIFKHADVRRLIRTTIRDAAVLAEKTAAHSALVLRDADQVSDVTLQVFQQATRSPGKWRLLIEKDLGREIGKNGERILRIVLDMSGRVVTAFPVKEFTTLGVAVGVMDAFTERIANAAEIAVPLMSEEEHGIEWADEAAEFFNPLYSGSLSNSETRQLQLLQLVDEVTKETIIDIETTDLLTLSENERTRIRELVWDALTFPQYLAGDSDVSAEEAQ